VKKYFRDVFFDFYVGGWCRFLFTGDIYLLLRSFRVSTAIILYDDRLTKDEGVTGFPEIASRSLVFNMP
jgi:hypothetical protein